jgi:hypothetical protein
MTNLYHILDKFPAMEKEEMFIEHEYLAQSLVKSGRLRIDAHDKINFARLSIPYQNLNLMISLRQLTDENLLPYTANIIEKIYSKQFHGQMLKQKIKQEIARLINQIKKYQPISKEMEIKLARIIVQAAHPVVIRLMLIEQVEVFVSYSYNIGDMLDIVSWQESGSNSGMQSTDGKKAAIFVSCGGNPLADTEKDAIFGDGLPAIARMVIIAAQEIGHYSDILRDPRGRQISRHSADFGGNKAKENVRQARISDIKNMQDMKLVFNKYGMKKMSEYERHIKFFKKNKRRGIIVLWSKFKLLILKQKFINSVPKKYSNIIKKNISEKFLASKLEAYINDMEFNLAPKADVYMRENKVEEEAIACIEALARVPQQCVKWGDLMAKAGMPNLHNIYYNQVIPACIQTYNIFTGQSYTPNMRKFNFNIFKYLKKTFKKKPKPSFIWEF